MFFVKYSYRVGYIELQSWHLTLGNSINSDFTNSKNGDPRFLDTIRNKR